MSTGDDIEFAYPALIREIEFNAEALSHLRTVTASVLGLGVAILTFLGSEILKVPAAFSAARVLSVIAIASAAAFLLYGFYLMRLRSDVVSWPDVSAIMKQAGSFRDTQRELIDELAAWTRHGSQQLETLQYKTYLLISLLAASSTLWLVWLREIVT